MCIVFEAIPVLLTDCKFEKKAGLYIKYVDVIVICINIHV